MWRHLKKQTKYAPKKKNIEELQTSNFVVTLAHTHEDGNAMEKTATKKM